MSEQVGTRKSLTAYLCRFSNLASNNFPLVRVIFFDGRKQGSTLYYESVVKLQGRNILRLKTIKLAQHTHLVFTELSIVHILPSSVCISLSGVMGDIYLVPVFLYATLCPGRKCLCYLTP